jgi:S1-C subfamily serine protease
MRGGEIAARVALDLRLRREAEGGVAADAAGRVIGMTVFGPRQQVLVIPTATIARVANLLVSQGRVPRGYLGLSLQPVALEGGARGAMVMGVDPQGPGAASGIHLGDVIVSWNDEAIDGVRSIQRALGPQSVGAVVSLELRRAGERQVKMLTIAERPAA